LTQKYSSCAENRPGSGVISTFVFLLDTIACILQLLLTVKLLGVLQRFCQHSVTAQQWCNHLMMQKTVLFGVAPISQPSLSG